ncbi:unnamed protein product [Cyclocybe aegerita]|uniref:snRNA-activating protein complex subunit 3 n=1 Tax=Cyclocybe aegerita TaxID=1973307 RepID=A0A8S0WNM5_CYCAE|nr:unnamed protein product [Cyclocybe aegerita]
MNAGLAHTMDSLFGPPSEPVDISAFLESTSSLPHGFTTSEPESQDIADECNVSDIQQSISDIWNEPTLSAHLMKDHDHIVCALHSINSKTSKPGRKANLPDPDTLSLQVTNLQKAMDAVSLKSFKLNTDAVLFMRGPKNSDQNILDKVMSAGSDIVAGNHDAILIMSIHDRVPWGPSYVTRSSQHVLLASQTLQDLCDTIPCVSNNLPKEVGIPEGSGSVIVVEGRVYGSDDYAEKLFEHLNKLGKKGSESISKAPSSLQKTKFSSLTLRLDEPYWLVHRGNCEHFLVVDQIRLLHLSDPRSGYPLKLQITPTLLDLCRACGKIPAVWSIVGDVRLGESPCVLCGPCWKSMGDPEGEEVVALSLPDYKYY